MPTNLHSEEDFIGMRKAGRLAADVLDYIGDFIKIGVTTLEINDLCHEMIIKNNAIPAPLNYRGFPKSVCTSVNHVVCHGIPDNTRLKNGDIINVDVTVIVDGWHGDTSRTFFVGTPSVKAKRLTRVTYECLMMAIDLVKPDVPLREIGIIIEQHAKKHGYSSVRDFCGHGIGRVFHEDPNILHYDDPATKGIIQEGMFFTIEPMINAGTYHTKLNKNDGWTATTRDRELSAQFEHTIGVTKTGCEIFTKSSKNLDHPNFE